MTRSWRPRCGSCSRRWRSSRPRCQPTRRPARPGSARRSLREKHGLRGVPPDGGRLPAVPAHPRRPAHLHGRRRRLARAGRGRPGLAADRRRRAGELPALLPRRLPAGLDELAGREPRGLRGRHRGQHGRAGSPTGATRRPGSPGGPRRARCSPSPRRTSRRRSTGAPTRSPATAPRRRGCCRSAPVNDVAIEDAGTALLTGSVAHEPAFWKRYRGGRAGKLWTATGHGPPPLPPSSVHAGAQRPGWSAGRPDADRGPAVLPVRSRGHREHLLVRAGRQRGPPAYRS